ncbi:hypothetical protein, partial [Nocardia aurantiaca]|nr:hypothetical protein [Nocardia aurantiaca]
MPKSNGHRKETAHTIGRVADTVSRAGARVADTASRAGATAGKTVTASAPTGVLQQSVQNLAGTMAERAV